MDPNIYKKNAVEIEKRIRKLYFFRFIRVLPIIFIVAAFLLAYCTKK